ncbi:hypothetical protein ACVIHC_002212 [Bradyrhizobium diazoefficiens]
MTHIIMSGPIRPLTEAERVFARLKLAELRDNHEPSTAHIAPPKVKYSELRTEARLEGFVTLGKAAQMLGAAPATALMLSSAWRHQTIGSIKLYFAEDVLKAAAERSKRKRKLENERHQ